jgi:branched-chain amino acid transport system substrate-binding protein
MRVRTALGASAAALALAITACGSSSTSSDTGGAGSSSSVSLNLPATVNIGSITDLTGPAAFAGTRIKDGIEFAISEINSSGMLGSTKLSLDHYDGKSTTAGAQDAISRIKASQDVVMIGPIFSSEAQALVPVAQQSKLPTILVQSGVPGLVEQGNYIFRATPPQSSFVDKTAKWVIQKFNAKKVAMIYAGFTATIKDLAETRFPQLFQAGGVQVIDNIGFASGQTDFSAIASKVAGEKPDAVGVLATGTANVTIITQLRQQGYTGPFFGQTGMSESLGPVAQQAEGTVWAQTFAPDSNVASSHKFAQAYQAAKGKAPSNFEAEGYDATYMTAYALKQAKSGSRDDFRDALDKVASAGFSGALGPITFETRDARVPGVLVQLKGGNTVFVN